MGQWLGSGLPPSALARMQRATDSGISFSQLAIASRLAIESCGFEPVGAVVGCTVKRSERGSFGLGDIGCGYLGTRPSQSKTLPARTVASTDGHQDPRGKAAGALMSAKKSPSWRAAASSHVSYAAPAHAAWRSAIDRMLLEAKALHADGVVDVRLSEEPRKGDARELVVTGTAVRSMGQSHLEVPFTTTLSGGDVAKLMAAGWMPASIVLGLSVAVLHETFRDHLARGTAALGLRACRDQRAGACRTTRCTQAAWLSDARDRGRWRRVELPGDALDSAAHDQSRPSRHRRRSQSYGDCHRRVRESDPSKDRAHLGHPAHWLNA
jgi:hypothetical protein